MKDDPRDQIHPVTVAILIGTGAICLGASAATLYPLLQPEAVKAAALGVFGILLCWMAL